MYVTPGLSVVHTRRPLQAPSLTAKHTRMDKEHCLLLIPDMKVLCYMSQYGSDYNADADVPKALDRRTRMRCMMINMIHPRVAAICWAGEMDGMKMEIRNAPH